MWRFEEKSRKPLHVLSERPQAFLAGVIWEQSSLPACPKQSRFHISFH
jgi:hypothetical protein